MISAFIDAEQIAGAERILTDDALSFLEALSKRFRSDIMSIIDVRRLKRQNFDFVYGEEGDWKVAPPPHDLIDRRVEITGPVDRKMIINAMNSGANVFMADFEDSCSPTWDNIVNGQVNLYDAVRRTIELTSEAGKQYRLNDEASLATLMVRPRGWHLFEKHCFIDGRRIRAALFDFGLYVFHNARELIARNTGPYFYLPKLESHREARLWNDIFNWTEDRLWLSRGTIRATALIETLPAAFEMDAILYELRAHSVGLNCGRWDYIFSFIKKQANDPLLALPDRSELTMDKGFLSAYCRLLIRTCHKRGAHAIGGMAAQIPIKDDLEANDLALARVKADKDREAMLGHDGTWVAHPGLIPIAKEAFKNVASSSLNDTLPSDPNRVRELMLGLGEFMLGSRTEQGLRHNIRVGIQYIEAWLRGQGCVPLHNLMEDAATAEICRAQVWQWIHRNAWVGGDFLTEERFIVTVDEETKTFVGGRYQEAKDLFVCLVTSPVFEEFLTIPAYEILEAK